MDAWKFTIETGYYRGPSVPYFLTHQVKTVVGELDKNADS